MQEFTCTRGWASALTPLLHQGRSPQETWAVPGRTDAVVGRETTVPTEGTVHVLAPHRPGCLGYSGDSGDTPQQEDSAAAGEGVSQSPGLVRGLCRGPRAVLWGSLQGLGQVVSSLTAGLTWHSLWRLTFWNVVGPREQARKARVRDQSQASVPAEGQLAVCPWRLVHGGGKLSGKGHQHRGR